MRRNKTITISKVSIRHADKDDTLRGWVRIPRNIRGGIENGSFVKMKANRKSVFCQVRGTTYDGNAIEINEHFRNLLGVEVGQEIDLKVTKIEWIFGKLRAVAMHPEHMVRFGIGFSFLGVLLGCIGLVTAILPSAIQQISSDWAWASWVTLGAILALTLFVGWIIGMVASIFTAEY